ncbi:MAG: family transporter [Solirubrobacterales bacterium]|nr:family transporter [Solirubrobacterales bacterium]
MNRRAWTLLLILAAIWGASYMFIKIGVREISPGMVAWARIALAALVLVGIAAARGALGGFGGRAGTLLLLGAVQVAAPFLLISAGEQEISSSLAGILVTSAPLFTALLAIWIDHEERSQGLRLVGVLLGVAGVGVLLGLDLGGSGDQLLGGLAVILAGLGYAVGGFIVKHRLGELPSIGVAAWAIVASTVLLIPAAIIGAPSEVPGLGPIAAVAVLGVLGTGIAFAIFYDLIANVGPARAFVVTYLAPGFAVVYGAVLLDEAVTVATVLGLALILGGSWLAAEGRLSLSRPPPAGEPPASTNEPNRARSRAIPRPQER